MTFQLDTSGEVWMEIPGHPNNGQAFTWLSLDAFTQGYVEALFEASMDDLTEERRREGNRLPLGFSDLSPETLTTIIKRCSAWMPQADHPFGDQDSGGEFWRSCQNDLFPRFPPLTPTLGDDGLIRFAPSSAEQMA